jgi:putative YphP/YqiW family bacilliredoxin
MVAPARQYMTRMGLEELRTPADVDAFMAKARTGTTLLAVNSMCGCASGTMRPAVGLALARAPRPQHAATVFAGQDLAATARAREYLEGHPPSSPAVALFRDGALTLLLQRSDILGRVPEAVAGVIADALARPASGHATG